MIKITGYSLEETKYSVSYNRSARVLDIESSPMSDDYTPHDESTGCMFWLSKNYTLGEIECIFPVETNNPGVLLSQNARHITGTPKLKISFEEKPVKVFFDDTKLLLIFSEGGEADTAYESSNLSFWALGDELVAMCMGYKLI